MTTTNQIVYAVNVVCSDGLIELELFTDKEQALAYSDEMSKLYDASCTLPDLQIGFWERTIDQVNPNTGFKPTIGGVKDGDDYKDNATIDYTEVDGRRVWSVDVLGDHTAEELKNIIETLSTRTGIC
jgi:hypothetical protein